MLGENDRSKILKYFPELSTVFEFFQKLTENINSDLSKVPYVFNMNL